MKPGHFVFAGDGPAVRKAISLLHARLIPYGPVPRLGQQFMEDTYYAVLPASGWLRCEVYSHGGEVLGFFTSAREEGSLLRSLGFLAFWKLGWGLFKAILASPRRILVLLELLGRSPGKDMVGTVELLSFGVGERYRDFLDPETGQRISTLLFERCMRHWKDGGVKTAFCRVKRENIPVLLFYKNYGADVRSHADDPTSYEVVFALKDWKPQSVS